jgi:gamma-tubulin complex component 2
MSSNIAYLYVYVKNRSLKHYFLLDQSDFMVHFMDIAEDEMQKNYKDIRISKLESLLEISLRITSANSDPFNDDLRVKLFNTDLKTMLVKHIKSLIGEDHKGYLLFMIFLLNYIYFIYRLFNFLLVSIKAEHRLTGYASFSLDYVIKWPIFLIFDTEVLFEF